MYVLVSKIHRSEMRGARRCTWLGDANLLNYSFTDNNGYVQDVEKSHAQAKASMGKFDWPIDQG